jgi:hypothetical protein
LSYYNDLTIDMSELSAPPRVASAARSWPRRVLLSALPAMLGVLVYLNALQNPFVYDAFHTVVENASLGNPSDIRTLILHDVSRPVVNFSYAIDRAIWGSGPFGFHLTNVLLHALDGCTVGAGTRRLATTGSLLDVVFTTTASDGNSLIAIVTRLGADAHRVVVFGPDGDAPIVWYQRSAWTCAGRSLTRRLRPSPP